MMAITHVLFAAASYAGISHATHTPLHPVTLLVAAIGGMLPDLDEPKSSIGRKLPFISYPLGMILGHRGFSHSLLCALLCVLGLTYQFGSAKVIITPLIVGYLSHLAGDSVTNTGIPFLWPSRQKYVLHLWNTGSLVEILFITPGIFAGLCWLMWQAWGLR